MKTSNVYRVVMAGLMATVVAGAAAIGQTPPKEQVVETKAAKGRGGEDAKYSDKTLNSMDAKARPAPPQKGGEKARGATVTCDVHFDNRTKWRIKVWTDRDYEGVVGPYGDLYTWAVAGPTELFGRADFTDGSVLTWGPVVVKCPPGGSYTWRLGN